MLRSFGHPDATCCDMVDVVGSSLKMVKFEPSVPNISQYVATGWPNARNMLRPTMLRYVALTCCDRLAGALEESTNSYREIIKDRIARSQLSTPRENYKHYLILPLTKFSKLFGY